MRWLGLIILIVLWPLGLTLVAILIVMMILDRIKNGPGVFGRMERGEGRFAFGKSKGKEANQADKTSTLEKIKIQTEDDPYKEFVQIYTNEISYKTGSGLLSTTTHTVFLRCHVSKKTYEIPDYIQIYVTTEYSREKKTLNKASDSDFVSYKVAKVSKESVLRRDRYTSWAEYSEERTIVIPMDSVENIADNPEKMFSISLHDDSNNKYIIDVPGSYFRDFLCFVRAWASSRGTTIVESSDAP